MPFKFFKYIEHFVIKLSSNFGRILIEETGVIAPQMFYVIPVKSCFYAGLPCNIWESPTVTMICRTRIFARDLIWRTRALIDLVAPNLSKPTGVVLRVTLSVLRRGLLGCRVINFITERGSDITVEAEDIFYPLSFTGKLIRLGQIGLSKRQGNRSDKRIVSRW